MARTSAARKTVDDTPPAETGTAPSSDVETAAELEARELIADSQNANPKPPISVIYRATETGRRLWLGEYATESVNPEFVAKKFGGGKFYVQHKTAEPGGGYKYAAHDTYDIDPSIKPEPLTAVGGVGEGSPAVAARPSRASTIESIMDAGVLQLLNQMNAQNELTLAMVKRLATDERRGPDWVALLAAVSPILAELLKSRKDPTDVAVQLAKIMKPDAPAATNTADTLTTLERLLTLSRKMGGAGGGAGEGEGSVMPVVAEGMRTLGALVQGIVNERTIKAEAAARAAGVPGTGAPAEPHHAPLALVPDVPEPSAPMPTTSPTPAARPWIAAVGDRLPLLLSAAKFLTPNAAAETISRNLTDDAYFDLLEDIQDQTPPGFAGRLVAAFPAAESLPADWFEQVVQLLATEADDAGAGETAAPSTPP